VDQETEEFRVVSPGALFARTFLPFVPVLVLLFFVMTALGSIPLGGRLLPGVGIGLLATAVAVLALYRKARRGVLGTVVRMSADGVELADGYGFRISMRWADVTAVGEVHSATVRPGAAVGRTVRIPVRGTLVNSGLIGWGRREVPPNAPAWMTRMLEAVPLDPQTGATQIAIPLGGLDPAWRIGHMGDWVRSYRPDLLPPVPGIL
jgi:hypothetical protein